MVVDAVVAVSLLSGVWRFMVGRSGSSAGAFPGWVFDAVVVVSLPEELSGLRRFMVGRSGSSAGVAVVLVVPESGVVPEDVPELAASGLRRFMVGRSASSLVAGLAVPDAVVVSGLPVDCVVWVEAGLL